MYLKLMANDDITLFKSLFQLYLSELSTYTNIDVDLGGYFYDNSTDKYLQEKDLLPLSIIKNNRMIGFILIQTGKFLPIKNIDYYIGEFFILKRYRQKGYGLESIYLTFKNFPGVYLVGQLQKNTPAIIFWDKIYRLFNIKVENYLEKMPDGDVFYLQKFNIKKV